MIINTTSDRGINLAGSYLARDRWRVICAGRAFGFQTVFPDWGCDEHLIGARDWTANLFHESVEAVAANVEVP